MSRTVWKVIERFMWQKKRELTWLYHKFDKHIFGASMIDEKKYLILQINYNNAIKPVIWYEIYYYKIDSNTHGVNFIWKQIFHTKNS